MRDQLANALAVLERRVFSLERRFRDLSGSAVKYLHQLLDVRITYEGGSAVADGDVLTYDVDLEKWVNAAPAGGGPYSMIRITGTDTAYATEWSEATPDWEMTDDPGSGIAGDVMAAIQVSEAGIYHVSASVDSAAPVLLFVSTTNSVSGTWSYVGAGSCNGQGAIVQDGTEGASGALDFPVTGGGRIFIRVTSSSAADWWLAAHLVAPIDIEGGTCGD